MYELDGDIGTHSYGSLESLRRQRKTAVFCIPLLHSGVVSLQYKENQGPLLVMIILPIASEEIACAGRETAH